MCAIQKSDCAKPTVRYLLHARISNFLPAHDMAPTLDDEEAGVMGLTQVEPSPVDETTEYNGGYFPAEEQREKAEELELARRTTTTLGLGASHGPVWWCASRHRYTCRTRD